LPDEKEQQKAGVYRLSAEERKGIERGLEAMRQRRFASDSEVAVIFAKARCASSS
jgi:hypothetical protein